MDFLYRPFLSSTLGITLILGTTVAVQAKTLMIDCPTNIKASEKLLETPSGWREFKQDLPHYLSGVEIFEGAPEENASLKPDTQNKQKALWHFQSNSTKFVVCKYSYTSIQLTQALPASAKNCTVSYKPYERSEGGNPIPNKILCG